MSKWLELAHRLKSDSTLSALNSTQVEAVVDILCLVMYADNRVSSMEEVELSDSLLKLPWFEGKEALIRDRVTQSSSSARYANTPEARRDFADSATGRFSDVGTVEAVFGLAAGMAFSDIVLHEREVEVLDLLASSFGIGADTATAIIDSYR